MTSAMPPEDNQGETPEVFEAPIVFTQLEHRWKAKGMVVECVICPNPHGFNLPPGWHLTGVDDDGMPEILQVW